jgi:hypothetical protein
MNVIDDSLCRIPCARLQRDGCEHVVAIRGSMRKLPRTEELAVVHHQFVRRADQSNAIAGRIEHAIRDRHVLPITAGDCVIACE